MIVFATVVGKFIDWVLVRVTLSELFLILINFIIKNY